MTNVKDGWAMLAAAIIDSGLRANDESFLKSEWCQTLKDLVSLSVELHDKKRDVTNTHINNGRARSFTEHGYTIIKHNRYRRH